MKTTTAIKTAVHSCASTADALLNPRTLAGVSGCQEGEILELLVCVGGVVAVTVVILVRIAAGVAAGVTVAVVSDAISVPGIIQREVSSSRLSLFKIR